VIGKVVKAGGSLMQAAQKDAGSGKYKGNFN